MIPDPEDSRTNLGPLALDRLLDAICRDEGPSALRQVIDVITSQDSGYHELSWNVWFVDIDLDRRLALYAHDFDPYQGEFALSEFEAALRLRLA